MGLRTHLSKRGPFYWLLLGVLLIIAGTYFGLQTERIYLYVGAGIGFVCCIYAVRLFRRRKMPEPTAYHDAAMDQTCELNYKPDNS